MSVTCIRRSGTKFVALVCGTNIDLIILLLSLWVPSTNVTSVYTGVAILLTWILRKACTFIVSCSIEVMPHNNIVWSRSKMWINHIQQYLFSVCGQFSKLFTRSLYAWSGQRANPIANLDSACWKNPLCKSFEQWTVTAYYNLRLMTLLFNSSTMKLHKNMNFFHFIFASFRQKSRCNIISLILN